jgi:hypothetical protein
MTSMPVWPKSVSSAITALGVVSTVLAVVYQRFFQGNHPTLIQILGEVLRICIIVTPISISVLSAIDTKFNLGLSWIVLRSSAETLKKEIYLYRTQVPPYDPESALTESRDVKLAQRIKAIGQRVMETQVNQSGLDIYKGPLPPYAADGDDGFSDMDWRDYMSWRLEDQFNYYRKKTVKLHKQQTRLQWLITLSGAAGTILAAFKGEVWVAVSSAVSAALISTLEFQRIETTLVAANQASNDLYGLRTWWRALSPEEQQKPQNLSTLVTLTENVIQSENAGWVQEMRDALSDMYGEGEKQEQAETEETEAEETEAEAKDTEKPSEQPPEEPKKPARPKASKPKPEGDTPPLKPQAS